MKWHPAPRPTSGPQLFARYAFPPNAKGYCGPEDATTVLAMIAAPDAGGDLRQWATHFDGAWPYLSLIASVSGIGDPLDRRVVEAYWLGTDLLRSVPLLDFGNSLRDRFRDRNPSGWSNLADHLAVSAFPHHSFHVLCVYPWVGLLRQGHVGIALDVLDRCRIRTGTVISMHGETAVVETEQLSYEGGNLTRGMTVTQPFRCLPGSCRPGDRVTVHWDWVCDIVSDEQANRLAAIEAGHLGLANSAHLVA